MACRSCVLYQGIDRSNLLEISSASLFLLTDGTMEANKSSSNTLCCENGGSAVGLDETPTPFIVDTKKALQFLTVAVMITIRHNSILRGDQTWDLGCRMGWPAFACARATVCSLGCLSVERRHFAEWLGLNTPSTIPGHP